MPAPTTLTSRDLAAPVAEAARVRSIDVLRGFALLGVLLMNMQAYAMIFAAYMNPHALGPASLLDFSCWCVNHVLADAKFITIFSMLFGAGIVLMTESAAARTGCSAGLHYRRMGWLALFGATHGVLLWYGDILFIYAVCGAAAYLFRRRRPRTLLIIALLLLLVSALFLATFGYHYEHNMSPAEQQEMIDMFAPAPELIQKTEAIYRSGWLTQLPHRAGEWLGMLQFLLVFGWRILGCMLLGMALFKAKVFSAERPARFYAALAVLGFGLGMPLAALGIRDQAAAGWQVTHSIGLGGLYNYAGSLLAALGWIGAILLLCRSRQLLSFQDRLAAVGRMAFSNYIMHSVICTTVFYGHGLGIFGRTNRLEQLGLVIAIAALQLWYSPWWLARFRFGPLEWLWRTLTYWRRQPFRRLSA
ncbi:MAG: DUF418 domain-containing protein [Planctomycetes bacterium]|nr:DUF418 domain-containing protein [Planctomycetota bacterium]